MKNRVKFLSAIVLVGITLSGCGPLVTSGPDVVVGGGIYPAPILTPPMGNPNAFRPGGPFGPGFAPGPHGRPHNPVFSPGYPSAGYPYPGYPNTGKPNPGNPGPGFNQSPGNPGANTPIAPNPGFGKPGNPENSGNSGNSNLGNPGNQRVPGTGRI